MENVAPPVGVTYMTPGPKWKSVTVWVILDPAAFQRNLERENAYRHALEAAPFWEGDPPPRPE